MLWARWARARHTQVTNKQQSTSKSYVPPSFILITAAPRRCQGHENCPCARVPLSPFSSLVCVQPTSHFRPPSPGFCESTLVPPACSAFFSLRHRVWYESRSFPLFFEPGIQSNKKVASLDPFRRVRSSAFNSATQVHQSTTFATFHAFPRDCAIVPSASLTDCPSLDRPWTQKARQSIETYVVFPKISLFYPLPLTIDLQETFLSLAFPRSNQLIVCSHTQK